MEATTETRFPGARRTLDECAPRSKAEALGSNKVDIAIVQGRMTCEPQKLKNTDFCSSSPSTNSWTLKEADRSFLQLKRDIVIQLVQNKAHCLGSRGG